MVIVLETLSALAAEPVQISNKKSFHIFSDSKYAKRLNSAVSNEYLYLLTTSSCVNRVGDFVKPGLFENEIKENGKIVIQAQDLRILESLGFEDL